LATIGFLARRRDFALARPAAIKFALNVFFAQGDARRTTVNDDADPATVGFAPGRDAEKLAEGAAHWAMFSSRLVK
jgi:hypothetical protein